MVPQRTQNIGIPHHGSYRRASHPIYETRAVNLVEYEEVWQWYRNHCTRSLDNSQCFAHNDGVMQDAFVLAERCDPHQANHHVHMGLMFSCAQEAMMFKLVWG